MSDTTTIDDLHASSDLRKLQEYVKRTGIERGFGDESIQDRFMLLVEEMGEVAKALRPLHGVKVASDSDRTELVHEVADVQLLLLSLCEKLDIDLWDAIVAKEMKNRQRNWV